MISQYNIGYIIFKYKSQSVDYKTSGIALMMSSAHCSNHIVLICIVVNYGLTLRKIA